MRCSSCQTENPEAAKFCLSCGEAFSITCANCHTTLPAGANFCSECGTPTAARPAAQAPGAPSAPPAPRARQRNPEAHTPPHLAEKILRSKAALEGERKQVTVLFADVKESMSLAETVDPEDWHRIMDGFFSILSDGVHRYEGTVNQYTGDGIMALFGAPIAHEDHAQRACYAALHLNDRLATYAERLRREEGLNFSVRMGINSGEVVIASIGDDLKMNYTAQGHTVGLAARMETLAAADKTCLSAGTAALVADYFNLRDLGAFNVKGVSEPVGVFELEGVGSHRTRLDVSRSRGLTRFVGRHKEMESLEAALAKASAGDSQVVSVAAEGGAGKSRLCYEFTEKCRARGLPVFTGHCVAHGRMIPFLPILQLLRQFFGIQDSDSERAAREKMAGRLLLIDPSLGDTLPLIFDFMGFPDPERPPPVLDPEPRRRMLFSALAQLIEASNEPEVIVLEDLHWVDGASEHFMKAFVDMLQGTSCLVILNYRPQYDATWLGGPSYTEIILEPLGDDALTEMLADLLGDHPSVAALTDNIRETTAGNPFFMEEVVRALNEAGSLEGSRGAYRLVRPAEDIILPASVQGVLAARIDHLDDQPKDVLETAAVIGKEFTEPVLCRVVDLDHDGLAGALDHLERAGFIYPREVYPEPEYAFSHPLTQEVAYRAQLGDRRKRIHAAVARAITELYPTKLEERAALLAHHWEGGDEFLEAAKARRKAAENAATKDLREAYRHWEKLIELVDGLPPSRERFDLAIDATVGMLQVCWRLGQLHEEAEKVYQWGKALAELCGEPLSKARITLAYGMYKSFVGELDTSLELYDRAAAEAEDTDDFFFRIELMGRRGYANLLTGDLSEALSLAREVQAMAGLEQRDQRVPLGDWIFFRAFTTLPLIYMGRLDEASEIVDSALRMAVEASESATVASLRGFGVTLAWFRGDAQSAMTHARAQLEHSMTMVSPALKIAAYDSLGVAHLLAENWNEAVEAFEASLRIAREAGVLLQSEALILANMAEAYRGRGDARLAFDTAREAAEVAKRHGTAMHECRANLFLGRVLLRAANGKYAHEAVEPLERALAIVERTGAKAYEPFVRLELAELAKHQGKTHVHEEQCTKACGLFAEIGAKAHRDRVEAPSAS